MDVELDSVLKQVGGYRRYHLTIFTLLGLSCFIPLCYQNLIIVFIGYEPPHHCKIPANRTLNDTIPYRVEDGEIIWDKCHMYVNSSLDNTTVPCNNGWTYYSDGYATIVTEWDLVCDNNHLVELSQVIYHCLCLVAEIFASYPVDRFGRKNMHIVSAICVAFTASSISLSVNLPMFVALRSITGFFCVTTLLSGITMIMELFDSDKIAFAGIGLEGPWMIAYLPMALIAWLITEWRYLQLALSIINVVWIVYIWILFESVPWLTVTGKFNQANKVLNTMARWNGVKLASPVRLRNVCDSQDQHQSANLLNSNNELTIQKHPIAVTTDDTEQPHDAKQNKQQPRDVTLSDVLELFKNPTLRTHSLVTIALWFANCVVYYEIILLSAMMPGDRFLNFFLIALVEIPAYFISYLVVKKYGRRIPTCLFHIGAGLPLFIGVFIPTETASGTDLTAISITLFMIGKFNISSSFAIMILFTKELFPTNIRGTSGGMGNMAGRIGAIVAPMMVYMTKTGLYWLPSVLCALISIGVGLLVLILPETKNNPLPQTVDDVIKLYGKSSQNTQSEQHDVILQETNIL